MANIEKFGQAETYLLMRFCGGSECQVCFSVNKSLPLEEIQRMLLFLESQNGKKVDGLHGRINIHFPSGEDCQKLLCSLRDSEYSEVFDLEWIKNLESGRILLGSNLISTFL